MTREELQIFAVNAMKNHRRVMLMWGTSVGKGFTAVRVVNEMRPSRVLLVVAETAHKKNWREEFVKAGCPELFDNNITAECYASLKNYVDTNWDMIIFDEAHHLGSEHRMAMLPKIKATYIMCLSATMDNRYLIDFLDIVYGKFYKSKVSLQDAIDNNYLPEPQIILHKMNLDSRHYTCVVIKEWGDKGKRKTIECKWEERWRYIKNKLAYPHVTLKIACTPLQKYQSLCEEMEYWKSVFMKTRQEFAHTKWMRLGSDRKKFLGEMKTLYARKLVGGMENKRFICFCTSILQADALGGKNAIHSNSDEKAAKLISRFNNKEINSLFAVGMLQEGQNLRDLDAGIIIQLDGKERPVMQKTGRAMRAKNPVQHILYYANTQDEQYMKHITEGFDERYIRTINV